MCAVLNEGKMVTENKKNKGKQEKQRFLHGSSLLLREMVLLVQVLYGLSRDQQNRKNQITISQLCQEMFILIFAW